jgi:methionyl aminopeptidase
MVLGGSKDIDALFRIGKIVANCLKHMAQAIRPGMTTAELDRVGALFLREAGARSAPRLVYQFPGDTCISVNEEAAHGVPGDRILREGDLVNIDVSAELDGYFADTGGSFPCGRIDEGLERLCAAARNALAAALREARAGRKISRIGRAIETVARDAGYSVIRNLGSHGVGRGLHEEPKFIAGYFDKQDRRLLERGMVITIEPFLSTGCDWVEEGKDGWTLGSAPEFRHAQYEHTLAITDGDPILFTLAD